MDIGLKSKSLEFTFEIRSENLFSHVCLNFLNTPETASVQFLGWMYLSVIYSLVCKNKLFLT